MVGRNCGAPLERGSCELPLSVSKQAASLRRLGCPATLEDAKHQPQMRGCSVSKAPLDLAPLRRERTWRWNAVIPLSGNTADVWGCPDTSSW